MNRLEVSGVSVGYGKNDPIVRDISFTLKEGEILTMLGPNGSGKSTILKTLTGRIPIMAGAIRVMGKDLLVWKPEQLARHLAFVGTGKFQGEYMSCREVVEAGRFPYTGQLGILREEDRDAVKQAMVGMQVENLADREFSKISDGQRQRVLLARALCQETEILLLDEPTSYLDIGGKLEVLSLLRNMVKEKHMSVLLSMHETELAEKISDRCLCLKDGNVDRIGSPGEVLDRAYVKQLYAIPEAAEVFFPNWLKNR